MTAELPKVYEPKAVEQEIYARWEAAGAFHAEPDAPGEPFCIVIPPPNVTAALHLGHALNNTLQDVLIRWRRMQGRNALWMPGTDHAGIATQTVVDKRLLAEGEGGLARYRQMEAEGQDGRAKFVAKVQAWKDEYEATILHQLQQMGCSCDWRRTRFTMDETCARAVRAAFFKLFSDGLIYRGKRLVNWDPATQTVLADDEVEHEEVHGHFWYLQYPLAEKASVGGETIDHVTVATTRPETMLGDTAVAMNPRDPRAAALVGKMVRLPIVGRLIPIIADEHVVMPDPNSDDEKAKFSTGFLKVTPAHDPDDYAIRERHNAAHPKAPIDIVNILAPDGTISQKHGWPDWEKVSKNAEGGPNTDLEALIGLDRFVARKQIEKWFDHAGLLEKKVDYVHQVGHSYRSHVPIEPYLSDQWYVAVKKPISDPDSRIADWQKAHPELVETEGGVAYLKGTDVPAGSLAGLALMPLLDGRLRFIPDRYARTYQTWVENLRDWPISRQLWWGHRIPVWSQDLALPTDVAAGPAAGHECDARVVAAVDRAIGGDFDAMMRKISVRYYFVVLKHPEKPDWRRTYICLDRDEPAAVELIERGGWKRDPDVLDTWFSSALWPFSTMGWPAETPELQTFYPGDVLCTAREIITLWVSRMVMMGQYCRGDIPFSDVFIHAMIQDGEGRKMSKSLGNGIDPLDIIDSHGADAMRFTLVSMTTQTQDVRMPVASMTLPDGRKVNSSPKFDMGRNFCNKLWNASRFAMMNLRPCPPWSEVRPSENLADRWVLSRLSATVRDATAALEGFRFNELGDTLYHFLWDDFCDWYLEIAKARINSGEAQPRAVLAHCLDVILRLLHPVAPFITEAIWAKLNEAAPVRGPGRAEAEPTAPSPAEPLLVRAAWPKADASFLDPAAEKDFAAVQDLIRQVRNVRTQHNVPPGKKLQAEARVEVGAEALADLLRANRGLFLSLAGLEEMKVVAAVHGQDVHAANGQDGRATHGRDARSTADAAAISAAGVKLYIFGAVDRAAELTRLTKQRETLTKGVASIEAKLASAGFLAKAPPAVVEKERVRLESLKAELAAVEKSLAGLQA